MVPRLRRAAPAPAVSTPDEATAHLPQTSVLIFDRDLHVRTVAGATLGERELADLSDSCRGALAGETVVREYRSPDDARAYWLQVVPMRDDGGAIVGAMAVSLDITERANVEEALRRSEERFRKAFDEAPTGMALVGLDGRLEQVNASLCDITGYPPSELVGRSLASIVHPEDAAGEIEQLQRLLAGERDTHRGELRVMHSSGHPLTAALHAAAIRGSTGAPDHLLLQIQDITDRKRFEDQLQFMADHDPLTGLLNRRGFERELERHISRVKRYGVEGALLALDLDHFKYINDTLGHNAGDELISRVTGVLRGRLRSSDVLARLGGDEFAVLLPRADGDQARTVAEALLASVRDEEIHLNPQRPSHITTSVGVTVFDDEELTGEEMLIRADLAMYDAKEAGRDRVAFYANGAQAEPRMRARLTWVDRIREALRENRLLLHAQPIVSLRPELPSMYEMLLRMVDENGDLIPPSTFLYVAERFGLIGEIDRWVATQAVDLLEQAAGAGRAVPLSVNVSAKSLGDTELLSLIEGLLGTRAVPPEMLIFEITETAAIANIQPARRFAERLRELGCRLALDDFGSGFGSFYYLKHLPFDFLKIDGEFVTNCLGSPTDQLLIEAVVSIAQGLGKLTIAEFTPDQETLDFLRSRGVDFTQSYFTGAPGPVQETELVADAYRGATAGAGA
ncbi:MAG TPA: EAL domain-containing protein [Solirubrobacteraceae bacterium]|nr:EAL domain-containing protein [Solirubrobacteraceae bacterium]